MPRSAATGAMTLLTEYDDASGQEVRSLRLEPAADGNGWAVTFRDTSSAKLFACKIAAGQIACN